MLALERLRDALAYDQDSGEFRWRNPPKKMRIGQFAGRVCNGYLVIGLDWRTYYAHRLAWFYVHGVWPKAVIDHINGDKSDNRLSNLREATVSQNGAHRLRQEPRNTSGYRGIYWHKDARKWAASIGFEGQVKHIGLYDDITEASLARDIYARQLFGKFYLPLST